MTRKRLALKETSGSIYCLLSRFIVCIQLNYTSPCTNAGMKSKNLEAILYFAFMVLIVALHNITSTLNMITMDATF